MGAFEGAKKLFHDEPWLASAALGLACALTALGGMRLNTIDGIYPVDLSLTARHLLGAAATLGALLVARRVGDKPFLSASPRRVLAIGTCFSLALLARYSEHLFITPIPGVTMLGKLFEEFFGVLLVLAWAERVVTWGMRRAVSVFGLAVLSMGGIQVLLTVFQRVPCMLALVLLPLVSAALFKSRAACSAEAPREVGPEDGLDTVDLTSKGSLALVAAVVLCFVYTTGQILQPTLVIQETHFSSQLSIAVGNLLAGACVLAVSCVLDRVREQPRFALTLFFLVMFALTTVALSMVNYLNSVLVTVYLALASLGTFLIMLVAWVLPFARLPRGWTPFMVVVLGYGCNFVARMLSTLAMNVAATHPGFPAGIVSGAALGAALLCSLVFIARQGALVGAHEGAATGRADDVSSPGFQVPSAPHPHPTPHRDAIASLCELYGLTAQEGRVLSLCSKGKNASNISQELGVSLNTTKSHMRVLYAKLGVHSQQELIKLVDEAFAEARRAG